MKVTGLIVAQIVFFSASLSAADLNIKNLNFKDFLKLPRAVASDTPVGNLVENYSNDIYTFPEGKKIKGLFYLDKTIWAWSDILPTNQKPLNGGRKLAHAQADNFRYSICTDQKALLQEGFPATTLAVIRREAKKVTVIIITVDGALMANVDDNGKVTQRCAKCSKLLPNSEFNCPECLTCSGNGSPSKTSRRGTQYDKSEGGGRQPQGRTWRMRSGQGNTDGG